MVSICLPCLNAANFLNERLDSILNQTYSNWELIVADSFSTDGTWNLLLERLGGDSRASLHQVPPGLYEAWNFCINKSTGSYIYFATADDTMEPNALTAMVEALEKYPDCDIVHSNLRVIDDSGDEISDFYRKKCLVAQYFGGLLESPHIRRAPHDGMLHYLGSSVYVSITQLLIRRQVFETIGRFRTDIGSTADFEWAMRAGLKCNTVHVPKVLSSWRLHTSQATDIKQLNTKSSSLSQLKMTRLAIKSTKPPFDLQHKQFDQGSWEQVFVINAIALSLSQTDNLFLKSVKWLQFVLRWPKTAWLYIRLRMAGRIFDPIQHTKTRFAAFGLHQLVERDCPPAG